jgi:ribosomal protein L11 methyltransferase
MAWRELRFVCDAAVADAISDALIGAGAISVSIEDADAGTAAEQPLFGEPGSASEAAWARNTVVVLVDSGVDTQGMVAAAAHQVGLVTLPRVASVNVPEQDWVRLTQSQFDPIRISERLWIVPSWHSTPDPSAVSIKLDPGLAFGTGSHPTTRMCLEWLDLHLEPGDTVLDYGCGSGILGIAAALLGAGSVLATDIDEQALAATRDNALANHVAISVFPPNRWPEKAFAVVIANILTNPLKVLAPALTAHVRAGGKLTLSGILESQARDVITAYAPLLKLDIWRSEGGWVCLTGVKPPAS